MALGHPATAPQQQGRLGRNDREDDADRNADQCNEISDAKSHFELPLFL
jgi:hypothetical protein